MSVTNNINFIKPTQFKMVIDKEQYGNFNYFCTTFSLPSISATEVQTNFRGNQLSMPSEVIQYDPLNVRFLIDENFENYKEIFKWFQDNKGSDKPIVSDVTLIILSSIGMNNFLPIMFLPLLTTARAIDFFKFGL